MLKLWQMRAKRCLRVSPGSFHSLETVAGLLVSRSLSLSLESLVVS